MSIIGLEINTPGVYNKCVSIVASITGCSDLIARSLFISADMTILCIAVVSTAVKPYAVGDHHGKRDQ